MKTKEKNLMEKTKEFVTSKIAGHEDEVVGATYVVGSAIIYLCALKIGTDIAYKTGYKDGYSDAGAVCLALAAKAPKKFGKAARKIGALNMSSEIAALTDEIIKNNFYV